MKLFKLISSILLVISLTLPLTTCTVVEKSDLVEQSNQGESKIVNKYLVSSENSISQWFWVASFLLPLGFSITRYKKKTTIKSEVVFILIVIPACYVVWLHSLIGNLAAGGYMAITALFCLIISGLLSIQVLNKTLESSHEDA